MFFILSKTLALLLLPSNLFIAVGLAGLVLMLTRFRRAGRRIAMVGLVLLLMIAVLPVGICSRMCWRIVFRAGMQREAHRTASSCWAGPLARGCPSTAARRKSPTLPSAYLRSARLARQFPNARIIYSGGSASLDPDWPREADFLGPLLDSSALPRERVILEDKSRNTAENAIFSKAIAKPKPGERWLLVTSAVHMPRAIGCFRRVGFAVEAYPVDWNTVTHPDWGLSLSPVANLARADNAAHEWRGSARLLAHRPHQRVSARALSGGIIGMFEAIRRLRSVRVLVAPS